MEEVKSAPLMHKMTSPVVPSRPTQNFLPIGIIITVLVIGVVSGFLFSQKGKLAPAIPGNKATGEAGGKVEKGQVYGAADGKEFTDKTEGTLEKGGLEGEGSHKLIRPGGESQTVYLTSSILDLDSFTGKKVRVWGETFEPQKAGWFMDVGKLEVLE